MSSERIPRPEQTAIETARVALAAYDDPHPEWEHPTRSFEVARALRALIAEHEGTVREMHARELHHFETEKLLTEAGIDPDATPPTDDEREALARALYAEYRERIPGLLTWENDSKANEFRAQADRLLSHLCRQGPTDDEWEYASERYVDLFGGVQVRRIRRRKAGPWEPVDAARDAS